VDHREPPSPPQAISHRLHCITKKTLLLDAPQAWDPIIARHSNGSLAPHDETIPFPIVESAFVRTIGRNPQSGTREK
jgi:hypothetical protein